jgi:hypothetical protein
MTNGARNKQRRYPGSNGYALEYPEFGQLLMMLLEFLANYFKSMFPNLFPATPETGADNHDSYDDSASPAQPSAPNPGFGPSSYTPGMTASRTQPAAATPAAHAPTYSSSTRPAKR